MLLVVWGVQPDLAGILAATPGPSFTITLPYPGQADPGTVRNAQIAIHQMLTYFDSSTFTAGVDYSFNHDVLGGSLPKRLGYVDSGHGYGYGINLVASGLNTLVHEAFFWDQGSVERPIFEQVVGVPIKNDKALGVYAVSILLAPEGTQDYVWRLSPGYLGPAPRIFGSADATGISLTVMYTDAGAPTLTRASLTASLRALIGQQRIGVSLISPENPAAQINVHEDDQVPIASAWKGPGLTYFFAHVGPDVWRSVPVRYWKSEKITDVPLAYQQAWLDYHTILYDVYIMAVFSGNHEAGDVLGYVYRQSAPHSAASNPIIAFNDWCQEVMGLSPDSGLYNWRYGDLDQPGIFDGRYAQRRLVVGSTALFYSNLFSAHDLALAYVYLATVGRTQGFYDVAVALLSIRSEIVSKIQGQAPADLQTATKTGYFGPGSPHSLGHDVDNDAGLLIFPDGQVVAVAFTAFDAVDLENDVVGLVMRSLEGDPGLVTEAIF